MPFHADLASPLKSLTVPRRAVRPHGRTGLLALRGTGAPVLKSAESSPLSVHPWPARWFAVVFDSEGAGAAPSNALASP